MRKHTPKKKKLQIADGGDFVTAALGLLDTSESVQIPMFETDARKHYARHMMNYRNRKYTRCSVVYFLQVVSAEGYIKIGYTHHFQVRFWGIQVNSPYELKTLLLVSGGRDVERELHICFWQWHVRGEWFLPAPELLAYIDSMKARSEEL